MDRREAIVKRGERRRGFVPKDHVRRAIKLGATKKELVEVFQNAYFHTGALTLVHGMVALIDVLKELEDERKPAARTARRGGRRHAKRRSNK